LSAAADAVAEAVGKIAINANHHANKKLPGQTPGQLFIIRAFTAAVILISDKLVDKNPHKNPYMKAFDADFIYF
jgi:hypothetical protein